MSIQQVTIRRLGYSDLPQVIAIERRAFPTPWSLAMFVLELSKPSSICLAATHENETGSQLGGYLICARYADVWHVMNIAVDPPHRGHGIATMLLERLFELTIRAEGGVLPAAQIDGEEIPAGDRYFIEVAPRALRLVVPREHVDPAHVERAST